MSVFQHSRRQMLLGLAAAASVAAAPKKGAAQPSAAECPVLLEMAEELEAKSNAHTAARDEVRRIVREWGPEWPTPDGRIFRFGQGCKTHRGIDGCGIQTSWGVSNQMRVREIGTPEVFEESYAHHRREFQRKMATKSQRGAKFHKTWMDRDAAAIEPAKSYWAEVERITSASGIERAQEAETLARDALHHLVNRTVMHRERTVAGLIIKAQALQAWREVGDFYRVLNLSAPTWSDEMAATIVRQTSAFATA